MPDVLAPGSQITLAQIIAWLKNLAPDVASLQSLIPELQTLIAEVQANPELLGLLEEFLPGITPIIAELPEVSAVLAFLQTYIPLAQKLRAAGAISSH